MPEPGALPLRVLAGVDDDALHRFPFRELAGLELTNRAIASGVPRRRVGRHLADEPSHLVAPTGVEHRVDTGLDALRELRPWIHDEVARRPSRRAVPLAMQITH